MKSSVTRNSPLRAQAAGVDGVIIVDLPPEEAAPLNRQLRARQIDQIFPGYPHHHRAQRIERIAGIASGFLYYVSVKGTTGGKGADPAEVNDRLRLVRRKTDLPVAVGFGIKDADTAARVADYCDAVVIGSALVEAIHAAATAGGRYCCTGRVISRPGPADAGQGGMMRRVMSWLDKLLPSRIKTNSTTRRSVPEGVWTKCDNCNATLYRAELARNLEVCPKCGHHMRISARARLDGFLDAGDRVEIGPDIKPVDKLRFSRQQEIQGQAVKRLTRKPGKAMPW